jgi:hypothetical protein
MSDWWDSHNRGRTGLPPRDGENLSAYYSGRASNNQPDINADTNNAPASNNRPDINAGGLGILLIGGGIIYAIYKMVSGPLYDFVVIGLIATILTTVALRFWTGLGVKLPTLQLLYSVALAFASGLVAMLLFLGLGSLLHYSAEITIFNYISEIYSDSHGNRLEEPQYVIFIPNALSHMLHFIVPWAVTTLVASKRIQVATDNPRRSIMVLAALIGGSYFIVLQCYRLMPV